MASLGAFLGITGTAWLTRWAVGGGLPWLIAPMGASAVLLFAAPGSPLAQPWNAAVGNTLSAVVGVACARLVPDPALAGGLAVGLAIAVMSATRSLHPPGGAVALTAVLGGPAIQSLGFGYVAAPVALNTLLLLLLAAAFRYVVLGNRLQPPPG